MHEKILIYLGQGGIWTVNACWDLYYLEQNSQFDSMMPGYLTVGCSQDYFAMFLCREQARVYT